MSQEMMSRVAEEIRHQRWQDSLDEFYKKQEEEEAQSS